MCLACVFVCRGCCLAVVRGGALGSVDTCRVAWHTVQSLGQAVTDASRAAYNARAVQLDVHYARVVQRAMTDEQSRAERKQQDIDEEALAVGGSIRASKLAENVRTRSLGLCPLPTRVLT